MYKKLGFAIFYAGIAFVIYLYGGSILSWFHKSDHVAFVITMAIVMALFPVIPYPIVGGIIGAAYGPAIGGLITWIGSAAASIIMFLFVRYGYQDWGKRVLHKYNNIDKVTILFEKNAFLLILFARMIPVVPSIVVNIYSALSRVSFAAYAIASSVGKVPAMLLFALVGDSLLTEPGNMILAVGVYGIFLTLTLYIYHVWKKKQAVH
jgi:uncharacterized membrane protein YdjX (TVP38/TMEM64 family)